MSSNQQIRHGEVETLWKECEDFDRQRLADMTAGVLDRKSTRLNSSH